MTMLDTMSPIMSWIPRYAQSYATEMQKWNSRVAAGVQPEFPGTSSEFLVIANMFYLSFTFFLYFVMKRRGSPLKCRPFKSILLAYNATCVVLAGYVVWGIGSLLWGGSFSFVCNETVVPGSATDAGQAAFTAHIFWAFYAQKFWEFLDTWFFILRTSFRQVTFLHVFHHCSINIVVGLIIPFEFNGDMFLPILLNSLVHVLMYSHYLVSALGMATPWKPYLTSMQLIQFILIAIQSAMSVTRGETCGAPYFAKVTMIVYMGSMLALFGNFFCQSYILKKSDNGGGVIKRLEPLQMTRSHTGRAVLDESGAARVEVPMAANGGEVHYQVTPIGKPMPNLHVSRELTAEVGSFELAGGTAHAVVCWTVTMVITLLGPASRPQRALICCGDNVQDAQMCCGSDAEKKSL